MNKELEEWNKKAREQNIKVFKKEFKRDPINYQEVLLWIAAMINKNEPDENHIILMRKETFFD